MRTTTFTCLLVGALSCGLAVAQDREALQQRALAALGGEQAPPPRGAILSRRPPPDGGAVVAPVAGERQQHACPLCRQDLVQVPLWRERPGIDSSGEWTAHVCETDALFFVTLHGLWREAECGPLALPPAAAKVPRQFLPWAATPEKPTTPCREQAWSSADGSLFTEDADDGRLLVKNDKRTLFREPVGSGNPQMGIFACELSPRARLVAFARSMGPLIVGDLDTGKVKAKVPLGGANVHALGIAPHTAKVAFLVDDGTVSLRLLDVSTGRVQELARGMQQPPSVFLFVEPSGLLITAASIHHGHIEARSLGGRAVKWTATVDAPWTGYRLHVLSPDGKRLLVLTRGGSHAELLDATTGTVERTADVRPLTVPAGGGIAAAFSDDSRQYAWLVGDGRIVRSDIATSAELHRHFGAGDDLVDLHWAPDGKSIVTTDRRGQRLRWPISSFVMPD